MVTKIEKIIENFQGLDNEIRLELLMDYAENLPPVPEVYCTDDQLEKHRVHECQTPVSLWVRLIDGKIQIYAEVPRESPTVRGFVALLIEAFNGLSPAEIEMAPDDILFRTGLAHVLGMVRMQGLSAVYRRIKNEIRIANLVV